MIKSIDMVKRLLYMICVAFSCVACSQDGGMGSKDKILIDVVSSSVTSKTTIIENEDDMVAEEEFTINSYLTDGADTPYMKDVWVYYFNGNWRFRDVVNQNNLIDYYWPNDRKLNFMAYMPRDLNKTVVSSSDVSFSSASGVTINCTLPDVIDDITADDAIREASKREFIYALRRNLNNDNATVALKFVHPFSVIKFKLQQSHRDLRINYISLLGIHNSATYVNAADTYVSYPVNQDNLTYEKWTPTSSPSTFRINIDKIVPGDINFDRDITTSYMMVIPQELSSIKLVVNYTWDGITKTSSEIPISTPAVNVWQPAMKYVYSLNLGDNKEEILFKVQVEQWEKGEDSGYENDYQVQ